MCVSIDRSEIKNDYLEYKKIVEKVLIFIIVIYLLYIINAFFITKPIKIPLSFKVRIIVLIAVSIPIVGLWIITYLGMKNEERITLAKTEKIIAERMALFDKLKEDYLNSFTIDLLEHKKFIADYYFSENKNYCTRENF